MEPVTKIIISCVRPNVQHVVYDINKITTEKKVAFFLLFMDSKNSLPPEKNKESVVVYNGKEYPVSIPVPLQRKWCFWMNKPCFNGDYKQCRTNLTTIAIDTVQEFWKYYNNIPQPSKFFCVDGKRHTIEGHYVEGWSFFQSEISPDWEHPLNRKGCTISFQHHYTGNQIDNAWMFSLLDLTGEKIENGEHINGIRVVDRGKTYRLEIWLDTNDKKISQSIETYFIKNILNTISGIKATVKNNSGK